MGFTCVSVGFMPVVVHPIHLWNIGSIAARIFCLCGCTFGSYSLHPNPLKKSSSSSVNLWRSTPITLATADSLTTRTVADGSRVAALPLLTVGMQVLWKSISPAGAPTTLRPNSWTSGWTYRWPSRICRMESSTRMLAMSRPPVVSRNDSR